MSKQLRALLTAAALTLACDSPPAADDASRSMLPSDYLQRFVEVRACRPSIDHDLRRIVIKTERGMAGRYNAGPYPLDSGTLIIKEEFADPECQVLSGWTLMRKEPAGYDERFGDWRWQRLGPEGKILEDGKLPRCAGCHAAASCRTRDFACAEP